MFFITNVATQTFVSNSNMFYKDISIVTEVGGSDFLLASITKWNVHCMKERNNWVLFQDVLKNQDYFTHRKQRILFLEKGFKR